MRHGSLFSGIGGFDLAAEWMGWDNLFHCEINPFCQKILKHYWSNAKSYEDITRTDFSIWKGRVDIISGGFPCQPYSHAGKRLGSADSRHLWPEMCRAIQEIKPTYIVGENVRGLINWNGGLVFEEVCSDLENLGYEVQPLLLSAAGVGAPHRRDRIFFVADSDSDGFNELHSKNEIKSIDGRLNAFHDIDKNDGQGSFTESDSNGFQRSIPTDINKQQQSERKSAQERIPIYGGRLSFERFPTQSPICGGDDGLPTKLDGIAFSKWRQESVKAYGNAVVAPLVYEIFKVIQELENNK